jgi:hypothetical protein
VRRIGGMNHFLLPDDGTGRTCATPPRRWSDWSTSCSRTAPIAGGLEAKLFGGARIMPNLPDIGRRNAESALAFLRNEGIPCRSQSLGGNQARRVRFWPATGRAQQLSDRTARCRRNPEIAAERPSRTSRINRAFLTPAGRQDPNTKEQFGMFVFRKMSLVVKLALVAGLIHGLMATVMIFAILDMSYEKARENAELQASTALLVFEDKLASNSDTISSGSPRAVTTRRRCGMARPSSFHRTLERISDVTGARLTFFNMTSGPVSVHSHTHQRPPGDGRAAIGTTLDASTAPR